MNMRPWSPSWGRQQKITADCPPYSSPLSTTASGAGKRPKDIAEKVRVNIGPCWVILGNSWAILGHIWATLGHFWPFLGHFVAFLDKFAESKKKIAAPLGSHDSLLECMVENSTAIVLRL